MTENKNTDHQRLTTATGTPVVSHSNSMTAGKRGPILLQDVFLIEKLANFNREVIPERRMHAKVQVHSVHSL